MIKEKARPERLSLSEVYIYRNNQNVIAIVAVQPMSTHSFLSRS
jgi:hypothetical protein